MNDPARLVSKFGACWMEFSLTLQARFASVRFEKGAALEVGGSGEHCRSAQIIPAGTNPALAADSGTEF